MIPAHVKKYLKNRGVTTVGLADEASTKLTDEHKVEKPEAPDGSSATQEAPQMPDFSSMKYAELRKLLPNEVEAALPNKKKETLVSALEELFAEGKLQWPS